MSYFKVLGKIPEKDDEYVKTLVEPFLAGDENAREKLILQHLRLAIAMAARLKDDIFLDCAFVALVDSVDSFKTAKNHTNISGYIRSFIARRLQNEIGQMLVVPVPKSSFYRNGAASCVRLEDIGYFSDFCPLEFQETVNYCCRTEEEREILNLLLEDYCTKEISKIIEKSIPYVYKKRTLILERFECLLKSS